jgi:hypothetical protein
MMFMVTEFERKKDHVGHIPPQRDPMICQRTQRLAAVTIMQVIQSYLLQRKEKRNASHSMPLFII